MSKYRLYIDETGNSDLSSSDNPNNRYLSLTGVAFDLSYIQSTVSPDLELLKKKFFNSHPDDPVILHRKEMINKKYHFNVLKDEHIHKSFNVEFLSLLAKWEYVVFTAIIDKKELQNRYTTWRFDPYHYCLMVIIERYVLFLEEQNAKGDVLAESRGGKEDNRLKDSYNNLVKRGTDYIDSKMFTTFLTSVQLKVKQKSNNISGLQVADTIAHPSRREILIEKKIINKNREVFGDQIIRILQDKYYQKDGKVNGYGKKFLP